MADFNGDGRPDVFASCTGYDAPVNGKLPGEHPRLLLSQPDGRYANVPFPLVCNCHSASAADFDGSGFADIVLQDNALEGVVMFVNQRDGSFRRDRTRVPESAPFSNGYTTMLQWIVLHEGRIQGLYDYPAVSIAP